MFEGGPAGENTPPLSYRSVGVAAAVPVRFQLVLQNLGKVGVLEPRVERGDARLQVSESPVRHRSTEIKTPEIRYVDSGNEERSSRLRSRRCSTRTLLFGVW